MVTHRDGEGTDVDNPEAMELAEIQFDLFISVAHKSGLSYKQIFSIILQRLEALVMQSDVEVLMKQ